MISKEARKIVRKIEVIDDWFCDNADREYSIRSEKALELLEKLEDVEDGKN